ncbi:uncharacterized protein ACRADG_001817 [Cochliomyia hominivorax]
MKILGVIVIFFLIQTINGQKDSQNHKPVHQDQVQVGIQNKVSGHNVQVAQQVPSQQQHVAHQNSAVNPQHVVSHNKQRMVRSLENRQPFKVQEIPGKCNFICNQENLTTCGFNGLCHREFESQCELNIYNCINTHKIFHIVDDISCMDETTVKCYRGDM